MNRRIRVCICTVLSLITTLWAYSNQSYNVKYITTKQGLSNNYVTCGCEDNNGFIWFGTQDGLNRWDGYQMKIYQTETDNSYSLPDNFIRSIGSDQSGNLWIGTNEAGAVRYSMEEDKFYRYPIDYFNKNAFPSVYAKKIFVDSDGMVWFGTNYGLVKYNAAEDNFQRIYLLPENEVIHKQELIIDFFKIDDESFGVQSDLGLFKITTNHSTPFSIPFEIHNATSILESNPVFVSSEQDVWFADPEVLYYHNRLANKTYLFKSNASVVSSLSSNDVSGLFQDSQNNMWITTWDGGVNLFHPNNKTFTVFSENNIGDLRLSNNIVTSIFEDSYHNIWFTTEEGGVSYLNASKNRMAFYNNDPFDKNSLSGKKVGAFLSDRSGKVWIGTNDGGLNSFAPNDKVFERYSIENESSSPSILGLAFADQNSMYVTGWGLGLFKFDYRKKTFTNILASVPGVDYTDKYTINVKGFSIDKNGFVWLATHSANGLTIYDPKKNCVYNKSNSGEFNKQLLSIPYSTSIFHDSRERIWVATYGGLYMYDGNFHSYQFSDKDSTTISSNIIYTIYEDEKGVIWLGNSEGLDKVTTSDKGISFQSVNSSLQLPKDIKSIVSDNAGKLWMSSNLGISSYDVENSQVRVFQFNSEASVQEFVERSCTKDAEGRLLFGTTNGFLMFHPDSLRYELHEPPIFFTDFRIFNESQRINEKNSPLTKSILYTDTVRLNYKQSVIGMEYAALDINSQGKIEYAYRMDGVDLKWNYVGDSRFTTYTNLAPGEYTFRVRTANGSQLNRLHEAKILIIITPPFWKTNWAYAIYLILFIAALLLFRREVLHREKLRSALKLEKLNIQNEQETNLMKLRFFTNISHEFRTPLTLIKAPIEKLLQSNDKLTESDKEFHYKMILDSANRLDTMVTQLMDYRKMEAGSLVLEPSNGDVVEFCKSVWANFEFLAAQKNVAFNFHTNLSSYVTAFDADKLEKVLSNLLSNALKNTPASKTIDLTVKLQTNSSDSLHSEIICISISDTGYGISEENLPHIFDRFYTVSSKKVDSVKGTGIGLALAKELVEMHGGEISVQSVQNKGATFTVSLPVGALPKSNPGLETKIELLGGSRAEDRRGRTTPVQGAKINKLLVVDDDSEMLKFLKRELAHEYEVITANNGKEGERLAIDELPDLILSDVMMPVVGGIELSQRIRKNERTSHIPIVLLTARYSQEKKIEGLEVGVNDYLMKPFNLEVLQLTISNIFKNRKKLIDKFKHSSSFYYDNQEVESSDQKLMQSAIELVLDNIANPKINADFMAEKLFVSRTVLYSKFEALTGQTVSEFVNNVRLKKSKQLLLVDDVNVSEVAYAVGFTSQSYFSRTFSKSFGYSPREYIKENKGT